MVLLLLTAVDAQGELREFTCHLPHIDNGFDLLTALVAEGHVLVKARLLEKGQWTQLPLEAFDENSVLPVIRQLEKEWQQILTKPLD